MEEKTNVIVLDDNQDDREFIEDVIQELFIPKEEYNIFSTKEDMYELLGNKIHIVILDHLVGPDNGYEIFQEIRKRNEWTFIIISTAYDDSDTILMYMNNDADRFVSKRNYIKWKEDLKKYLIKGFEVAKKNIEFIQFLKREKNEQRSN